MQEKVPNVNSRTEPTEELEESPYTTAGEDWQCQIVIKFAKIWQFQKQSALRLCSAGKKKKTHTQRFRNTGHKTGKQADYRQPYDTTGGQTLTPCLT